METAAYQDLSTSKPLSTVSPRRVPAAASSSVSSSSSEESNKAAEKQAEADLRQQQQRIIQQLKARDQEVRAHEAAHIAAGRPYINSGPSYTYQTGPDGRSYAIGGEVGLDTSAVANDPVATLRKAQTVQRAALAPVEPSPQDLRVASNAAQLAAQARIDIAAQRRQETQPDENQDTDASSASAIQSYGEDEFSEAGTSGFSQYA